MTVYNRNEIDRVIGELRRDLGRIERLLGQAHAAHVDPHDFSDDDRAHIEDDAHRLLRLIQPSLFAPEEPPHA